MKEETNAPIQGEAPLIQSVEGAVVVENNNEAQAVEEAAVEVVAEELPVIPAVIVNNEAAAENAAPPVGYKNRITVMFDQNDFKEVKRKGGMVKKAVKNHIHFNEMVNDDVTSDGLSTWLIAKLYHYQEMQRLQGAKNRFDTSLPINMTIMVNGQEKASNLKFSTNAKTLARLLDTTPRLVGWLYNPRQLNYGVSKADVKTFVSETNVLIAKGLPAPEKAPALPEAETAE